MLLLLLLAQIATPAEPEEIVVQARSSKCSVALRGHELSKAELERHIRTWASGVPVRVSAPDQASNRCLSKILFRLSDRGVRAVEFVGPAGPQTPDR